MEASASPATAATAGNPPNPPEDLCTLLGAHGIRLLLFELVKLMRRTRRMVLILHQMKKVAPDVGLQFGMLAQNRPASL